MSPPLFAKIIFSKTPGLLITEAVIGFAMGLVKKVVVIGCVMAFIILFLAVFDSVGVYYCPVKFVWDSTDDDCSICLASMTSTLKPCLELPCGHTFHENCADQWHKINPTCALCRRPSC